MVELTYRRRLLEILLDFFLIGLSFYLAFLLTYGTALSEADLQLFLTALPLAYLGSYLSFFYFGVYRGVWRYVGIDDLLGYGEGSFWWRAIRSGCDLPDFPARSLPARTGDLVRIIVIRTSGCVTLFLQDPRSWYMAGKRARKRSVS